MLDKMTPIRIVDESSEDRWNAWKARGVENDRAAQRRMLVLLGVLLVSGAVLASLGWF